MASGLDADACGPFTPYRCCPYCCDALAAWQCETMCASSQQLRNPGHCITSMPGPSRVGLTLRNRGLQGPKSAHSGCLCRGTRAGGCGPASSRGTSSCASASRPGSALAQRHLPACLLPPGLSMRRIRYAADCSCECTCRCLQAVSMQTCNIMLQRYDTAGLHAAWAWSRAMLQASDSKMHGFTDWAWSCCTPCITGL